MKGAAQRKRQKIWKSQNGLCFYCTNPLDLEKCTLDHLLPRVRGGGKHYSNVVVACRNCNFLLGSISSISELDAYYDTVFKYVESKEREIKLRGLVAKAPKETLF